MKEHGKIEKLKEVCLKLFQLKDDVQKYENEAMKIESNVRGLYLEHLIDTGELTWFLMKPIKGKKISELSQSEFQTSLDEYFTVKETDYYFQITEVNDFPDNYRLGHGVMFRFAAMPEQVRDIAMSLSKHEIGNAHPSNQDFWKEIFEKLIIPADPNLGHWLKISCSSISWNVSLDRAFEYAEESLDILRIAVSTAGFHLPQYAIAWNAKKSNASPVVKGVGFSKYPYNPRHQNIIDRLNDMYAKPSSDLEARIKDAIHFLRIADNNSPNYQRLFFYTAAIEHLLLGSNDQDVLRWKFSEKGAILLSNDVKERLDLAKELKAIYDKRCKIAHGEKSDYDFLLTTSCRNYLETIIMKLIYLIDTYNLRTIVRNEKNLGGYC